ncbi:MAG: type II toxin-antitoxin system Phd/YefM family antitoxin [Pseudomonadota bacterium]|nr:type II toxin-antitoxin system Phd/YefM family antitoxin [Pseudomonadota bacterium]
MQSMSARDAKNSFGKLIDMARAEPVAIEKHGRTVVVVLSIESYEMLRAGEGVSASVGGAQAHTGSPSRGAEDKNGKTS